MGENFEGEPEYDDFDGDDNMGEPEDDGFDGDDFVDDDFDGNDFGDDDFDGIDDVDDDFDGDDFGDDDDVNFYDEEPNEGDYSGDNDEFFGDYGGRDYADNDWMNLFAVFSFGWFLCGASLLVWTCYAHKSKAQWKKMDFADSEEKEQMIAV